MVTIAFVPSILLMVLVPLVLSFALVRKYNTPWMIFGLGALAFLVSYIVVSLASSGLTSSDAVASFTRGLEPVFLFMIYGVIMSLFQNAGRYASQRLGGAQTLTWGGAVVLAAGFAAISVVLIYGVSALTYYVSVLMFPPTAPDGVTPDQFVSMQQQVADFWNLSFTGAIVQTQLFPGLFQASLQFAASMVVWVGVGQKLWQWVAAAFALETAEMSVYYVVNYWMLLHLANNQQFSINFYGGAAIFLVLMAFNAGIVYLIYKKVKPLAPTTVPAPVIAKPAPGGKPVEKKLAPREKPVDEMKPAKKLKNTDLK